VLSDTAEFLYKTTDYYAPVFERAIIWNDPDIAINWPAGLSPSLSQKDALAARFADAEFFV
jgi:dTDP-4-dehydrorhamnose 3,5-epimerase